MSEQAPLLRVCALLNKHGAKYLIVGARACWLHGYVRATSDVDILIPEDPENHKRIIAALSELEDHAAAELTPQDFVDNVVVKVADEVEVDVSTHAWKVAYDEAHASALRQMIEGVKVPYVDFKRLFGTSKTNSCYLPPRSVINRL
jgi:predicted nucleotidyltransferase